MGRITAAAFIEKLAREERQTAKEHLKSVIREFIQYHKTGFPNFEPTTHYTFLDFEDLAEIYWQWAARFPELFSEEGIPFSQDEVLQNQEIAELQIIVTTTTDNSI